MQSADFNIQSVEAIKMAFNSLCCIYPYFIYVVQLNTTEKYTIRLEIIMTRVLIQTKNTDSVNAKIHKN